MMFGGLLLIAVNLVTVHQIDGREVDINPKAVTRLVEPRAAGDPKKQHNDKVNCIIHFTDGQYLSVRETCAEVRTLLTTD